MSVTVEFTATLQRKKIGSKQLKNKNLVAQLEGTAIITRLILVSIENILTETCGLSKSSPHWWAESLHEKLIVLIQALAKQSVF